MTSRNGLSPKFFDRWLIGMVWQKGHVIPGEDPNVWRKDDHCWWINFFHYGDRSSAFGWERDHVVSKALGGSDRIENLRPLHWFNNASRGGRLARGLAAAQLPKLPPSGFGHLVSPATERAKSPFNELAEVLAARPSQACTTGLMTGSRAVEVASPISPLAEALAARSPPERRKGLLPGLAAVSPSRPKL